MNALRGPAVLRMAGLIALVLGGALLTRSARTETPPIVLKTLELGRGPTLVFVHDLGMNRMMWLPMARKMISTHRIVLVDLPGHGESPMPENFKLEAAAAALDQVLAREKPESTVVVGHGLGGLIAMIGARAYPQRMRGVAVVSAAFQVGAGVPDQQRQQFLQILDQRYDDFLRLTFRQLGRDSAQAVAMHSQAVRVPKVAMMAYLRELVGTDTAGLTKGLKTPLLVVTTDRDTMAVRDSTGYLKQVGLDAVPGVRLHRLVGSGHYGMADQPDSLRARLIEFTDRVIAKR